MFDEWNENDEASKLISIGPDNDRAYFMQDIGEGEIARIINITFALGTDGSSIKPEGAEAASFETAGLAFNLWINAFEVYIRQQKEEMGDDIELSWRQRPVIKSCSCWKAHEAWGRFGLYQKKGSDWEFKSPEGESPLLLTPCFRITISGAGIVPDEEDYQKEVLARHIKAG